MPNKIQLVSINILNSKSKIFLFLAIYFIIYFLLYLEPEPAFTFCMNENTGTVQELAISTIKERQLQDKINRLTEENFDRNLDNMALRETLAEERLKHSINLKKLNVLERANSKLRHDLEQDRTLLRKVLLDYSKIRDSYSLLQIECQDLRHINKTLSESLTETTTEIKRLKEENSVLQFTSSSVDSLFLSADSIEFEALNNKRSLPLMEEEKIDTENLSKKPRQS